MVRARRLCGGFAFWKTQVEGTEMLFWLEMGISWLEGTVVVLERGIL